MDRCKLHFGGSSTPCGGKPCKTCIPFLAFKFTIIIVAGLLIGSAGLVLVESNPAAQLLNGPQSRITQGKNIIKHLDNIDKSITGIKQDITDIKYKLESE